MTSSNRIRQVRSGIIGTGFMGGVHAAAVRAAGGRVTCVADATVERAESARQRLYAERAASSATELIVDSDVDVVHICTPNGLHARLAEEAIHAGKSVICEKPMATNVADAQRLSTLTMSAGVFSAIPFVYRYYPTVREVRERIKAGDAGRLIVLHGSYLQDWLSSSASTDWRVDRTMGGASRAFGDIGVHWVDIVEFTTGHRVTRLSARTVTAFPQRADSAGVFDVETEDAATVLFETDRGAVGSLVVSQVAIGRKNRLWFSLDGTDASYVFDQERPDSLWVGGRSASQVIPRGPETLAAAAARYVVLPAGHPQGYQDCFNAFIADCYAAMLGDPPEGIPTFADGLRSAVLTEAVVASAATQCWVEVPWK